MQWWGRPKVDDSEHGVELHRSYGVKKRVTLATRLNEQLAKVLAVCLILLLGTIFALGMVWLTVALGTIGIMLAVIAVVVFIYVKPCRKLRKRLRFILKLRRKCRELGYKLSFTRGFFKALKLNGEGFDLTVDTGKKLWCVRFFTPKKYLSHLTFIDRNSIEIKTNITKSHFKFILGLNNVNVRRISYSFSDEPLPYHAKSVKALIVNPVPHDVFKKDPDGAVIPIGTGERLYDYTMYTGSGFIEALRRDDACD